jgi:hypothetical protein
MQLPDRIRQGIDSPMEDCINLKNARKKVFSDPFPRRSKRVSFANSKISGQPQAIDLA